MEKLIATTHGNILFCIGVRLSELRSEKKSLRHELKMATGCSPSLSADSVTSSAEDPTEGMITGDSYQVAGPTEVAKSPFPIVGFPNGSRETSRSPDQQVMSQKRPRYDPETTSSVSSAFTSTSFTLTLTAPLPQAPFLHPPRQLFTSFGGGTTISASTATTTVTTPVFPHLRLLAASIRVLS